MDFRSPPAVIQALHERVAHGVFGYTLPPAALVEVICGMLRTEYHWEVKPEWLVWLPGLVTGLNVVCRAVGSDGDDVITTVPVYPPFLSAPGHFGRNLVTVGLSVQNGRWSFDFDRFERALTARTRLFLFCNPHNPVGRVFSPDEQRRLAGICARHDVVICSDEIHAGLVLDADKRHVPMASLDPEIARRTITFLAPSKTYNLPGLGFSFAVISDGALRRRFHAAMAGIVPHVNAMGYAAALAAYRDSREWHGELLGYLRANRDLVMREINAMPGLAMTHVEATYLAWVDTRTADLDHPAAFFEAAGVGLSDGREFGAAGFLRLNFGCPRSVLKEALARMAKAMGGWRL